MSTYQPPATEPRRGHCPCCDDARARLSQLREDAFDRAELELARAHLDVARREADALRERVALAVREAARIAGERDAARGDLERAALAAQRLGAEAVAIRSQLDRALADVARLTSALQANEKAPPGDEDTTPRVVDVSDHEKRTTGQPGPLSGILPPTPPVGVWRKP